MTPRRQRMLAVGLAAAGLIVATVLTLRSFEDNMMFFVSPTEVVAGEYPEDRTFRIGGLVVDGSVQRESESLEVAFRVTDRRCEVPITYT
ncbi:MAG: cytochrome c maturation protein CcmE, partial [Pseudomonadota bacterium]